MGESLPASGVNTPARPRRQRLQRGWYPPFLVVHGRNDSLARVGEARLFAERLRAVSHHPVGYLELPYAQHAFDLFYSPRTLHVIRAVHRFASAVYADRTRCHRG